MARQGSLFSFPNPVNEVAARVVAGGVLILAAMALTADLPVLLIPLAYGFWARVLTGPTLSPLGQLATRVIAPRLTVRPRLVPGPPKRFAQGIGTVVTTAAVALWLTGNWWAAEVLLGMMVVFAFLESVLAICVGCSIFGFLMRRGLIPESVCEECADISRRPPGLRAHSTASG
ncbi:MAG TPA: DUF4395 domain-containing protein [Acidimicrobiales bacterium]|jgi:hypothetical protein